MTREEAAAEIAGLIADLTPIQDLEVAWPHAPRMRARTFITQMSFPEIMATSVRAVVFRAGKVVVIRERDGTRHINPGGRREAGETLEETCRREVLEECGWELGPLKPLGFHHFHHLGERPADFAFPWSDFIQPVHVAEGRTYHRAARDRTQIEAGSSLVAISRALRELPAGEAALLRAAVAWRAPG